MVEAEWGKVERPEHGARGGLDHYEMERVFRFMRQTRKSVIIAFRTLRIFRVRLFIVYPPCSLFLVA